MIERLMNEYGYRELATDDPIMPHVLNEDNTIGLGKNTTSKTEGSWPFDQTNHSNGSTPMGTLDIMSFYKKEPTPPTPTGDYMYFEAAEANSTVSMTSMLPTAPNLEYSTDGETWQEWQHTTADGAHTFDTLTLSAIGDRVYLRGNNPGGLFDTENMQFSHILMTGQIKAGGSITSIIDGDGVSLMEIPAGGFGPLFADPSGSNPNTCLITAPSFGNVTTIGEMGCYYMFLLCTNLTSGPNMRLITTIKAAGCVGMLGGCSSLHTVSDMESLTSVETGGCQTMCAYTDIVSAVNMPNLETIGDEAFIGMYGDCTFNMSDDGTTLNFDFPTPPVTAGERTFDTYYDIAQWMGNTNGFPSQVVDPLYFEAAEANSTVSMISTLPTAPNLEYSTDGVTWQEWQHTTAEGAHTFDTLTLTAVGDRVYLRGYNPNGLATGNPIDDQSQKFSMFSLTGDVQVGGSVQTLVDRTGETTVAVKMCGLFVDISQQSALSGVGAGLLPATILVPECYAAMFFMDKNIISAPILPATVVPENAYVFMFGDCLAMAELTCLATDITALQATASWVDGVSANGVFYKNPQMSGWGTGKNGIPTGWTVEDYNE